MSSHEKVKTPSIMVLPNNSLHSFIKAANVFSDHDDSVLSSVIFKSLLFERSCRILTWII